MNRHPDRKSEMRGLLSLHVAVLLFGASGLIGKIVLSPAVVVTCARSLIAGLALTAFLAWRNPQSFAAVRRHAGILAVSGALLAVHWWTFFEAIQRGTVALGLLTFATYPLFATLLGWRILREPLTRYDITACVLVMAGLTLVVPSWQFGARATQAAVFGVVSGFTFALLTLCNRRLTRTLPPLSIVAAQTSMAGLLLLPALLTRPVAATDWVWLVLLGIVFTGFAHVCFTKALGAVRATTAGVTAALEPVYGILLAWVLIHEEPTARIIAGGVLILGGAILGAWSSVRR